MLLGFRVAVSYIGLSVGPVLGGVLTQHFGWRSIFLAAIPLGAIAISMLLLERDEWTERLPEQFDLAGSVIYGLMLLSLMYGHSLMPEPEGWLCIILGVPLLALLTFRELRTESPILDVGLFWHNHVFAFSNIAALINCCATFAVGFLLALYLQFNRGLDPQTPSRPDSSL